MIKELNLAVQAVLREVHVGSRIIRDPRTPWTARVLLGLAVAYAASPVDLVPDFIPLLGQLDDLVVVPLLIAAALALVPSEVVREHRGALPLGTRGG